MTTAATETPETEVITVEEHERRMAAFRVNVRTEAMEMAREHGLCDVVEATLKKVGIDSKIRYLTITSTQQVVRVLKVPVDLLATLDEDAIAKVAKQYIAGGLPNPRAWQAVEQINQTITEVGDPVVVIADETPGAYEWRFTSREGRVKHMVKMLGPNQFEDRAMCGIRFSEQWSRWPHWSSRDEGRNCSRCEERYAQSITS